MSLLSTSNVNQSHLGITECSFCTVRKVLKGSGAWYKLDCAIEMYISRTCALASPQNLILTGSRGCFDNTQVWSSKGLNSPDTAISWRLN